jgi:hypothetical protein
LGGLTIVAQRRAVAERADWAVAVTATQTRPRPE